MVDLQRASAGSGKTYTLAGRFIWYYITISEEGGARRLRTKAELADSLSHILAVTFTNKATNEMQQRIVEKLYALGSYSGEGKLPDYMKDFMDVLGVSAEDIAEVCARGVSMLLNNYSDFHVSTIDSFFQQVLRTFAYESDLSDSYRIELDTDFLSAMAIDALLEEINTGKSKSDAVFWIGELISRAKEDGKKWNVFARRDSKNAPYELLTESVKRLENEEFKEIRHILDSYFAEEPDLPALYEDLKRKYEGPIRKEHSRLRKLAKRCAAELDSLSLNIDEKDMKTFRKVLTSFGRSKPTELATDSKNNPLESIAPSYPGTYFTRKRQGATASYQLAEDLISELSDAYDEWAGKLLSRGFRHWALYKDNLPFMGLLQAIRDKRDGYLRENNAIELGETNAMLHDIIGEDEAPFIYERIGARLNHFLIDEFQDTSDMQWRNMSPLLHESVSRGNENLIIGDAKQSIYRFRNADSSLITEKVPAEFGLSTEAAASGSERNTNWRSDLRVVQFNNSFFEYLAGELNRFVGIEVSEQRRDFERDYRNVVQHPHHKDKRGYVEARLIQRDGIGWSEYVLASVTDIVEDCRSRGFRLRDIAVLVDRNDQGEAVIEAFTEYNARLATGSKPIEYVSEQSLKLSSSAAVSMVVSVLETVSRGADPEVREGEERAKKGVADWSEVACNFRFFALRNPELSTPDALERFLAEGGDNDAILKMLAKMQAVTLPALVESIIAEFMPETIRRNDAVFLAAFQDIVLEYCENRPSDIASFLKWWNDKKKSASIASPEDMDAVTVMTVHKSKGLEFPVVIVPFADFSFKDQVKKPEWRWVRPEVIESENGALPPFLPISTDKGVEGTTHEGMLYEYYDLRKMDAMNSIYVAFTRAANELYIFSKPGGKTEDEVLMSTLLKNFFLNEAGRTEPRRIEYVTRGMIGQGDFTDEPVDFSYGEKYERFEHGNKKGSVKESVIGDYTVRSTPDFLLYRVEALPEVEDVEDVELKEKDDPRSEGNILHAIMQGVDRQSDIPRAIRRMVLKGLITKSEGSRLGAILTVATSRPDVKGWFEGDGRVINERPLLRSGRVMRRPDRVMVSPQGDAVVVDYKFGESMSTHKRYARQVHDYVEQLKNTGKFRSVKGYLWYVKLNRLEFISE